MQNQGSSTKERISKAIKDLTGRKSFHKITINDIASECGMTRENFYYHFRDKYDILNWIFLKEVAEPIAPTGDFIMWMEELILCVSAGRGFYVRVLHDEGREVLKAVFYPVMEEKIRETVRISLEPPSAKSREKEDLVTSFFTDAFIDLLFRQVIEKEITDAGRFDDNFEFLICNFLPFVRNQKENKLVKG